MNEIDFHKLPYRSESPHIKTSSIVCGLVASTDLDATQRFYEDMLGLECVRVSNERMLARDGASIVGPRKGNPSWLLDVRKRAEIERPQRVLHHWGIDLVSKASVEAMHNRVQTFQADYGIRQIFQPQFQHGSYAFYLQDLDTNWWEFQFVPQSRKATKFVVGDFVDPAFDRQGKD
ncbi:hypothetical protein GCM10007242_27770 [Pigmentiphaga litoralis]|uniref:VOC family protein n=1 Tax=Pigmentiphaga litoralis TaxID=516702 RepID=UPI00167AA8ED|nr:VOC family protein [Pigmentiphaga litoralis]GGX19362.1 hypothetical protein GCM10007242_27770 [Pigmentiphaga litoralis]